MLQWYYKLLALHPKWVAVIIMILSFTCTFLSITMKKLPDFTDPALVSDMQIKNFIHKSFLEFI